MAFPWKAVWGGTKAVSPVLGVGGLGLYGAATTNSDINTEQVRGAGITTGLGVGAIGLGYGAYKGTAAIWKNGWPEKKKAMSNPMNASTYPSANPNLGGRNAKMYEKAKMRSGIGEYNQSTYPSARPGYRPSKVIGKTNKKSLNIGRRAGGTLGLLATAGVGIYAAASMISYRDDASSLAANIAGSAASSSGFDPGEGGSHYQSANQQFISSTEGLVFGLHRSRH